MLGFLLCGFCGRLSQLWLLIRTYHSSWMDCPGPLGWSATLTLPSNCDSRNVWKHHQCPLERRYEPTSSVNSSRAQRDQCGVLTPKDLESPHLRFLLHLVLDTISAFSQPICPLLRSRCLSKPPRDRQESPFCSPK